jgi:hypothetical protein
MLIALAVLAAASAARAETVTLQQGQGGYAGCRTATLWNPKIAPKADAASPTASAVAASATPAGAAPAGVLALRGSQNRLLLAFNLPADLAGKRLARARLEVFVPAAKNLRMICEILARPVLEPWAADATWTDAASGRPWRTPGGTTDATTDFGRGRPAGAADSFELWEYDGQYFPHKYAFLAVPEGGRWMDFNVTPLVRRWLADASANHGVALEPVDLGDKRFPNRAEIDIPAADSPDAAHRPRLVLEFEPSDPYLVGATHALRKICDRSTRYRFAGPFEDAHEMAMARGEYEPLQVVVYPMTGPLAGVTLEPSDLVDAKTGAKIPAADVTWNVQEVFRLHENNKVRDWYFHGRNFDVPDPLAPPRPTDCPAQMATPFWVTVRTRPETPAGMYAGRITVRPKDGPPRDVRLTVRVWNYAIPAKWNFQTMGQTGWDYIGRAYGKVTPELRRRFVDFLLDHRFNPTEQYADTLSPAREDLAYCIQRGANTIYLSGNFTGDIRTLKERYGEVKRRGLIDDALVYIGDETKDWAEMRRRSDAIRRACPELMIMIGGSFPRRELDGVIDIFDPQIDTKANAVYSLPADQMKPLIAASQAKGERFFWYVAAGPMLPCPNVQMEDPLIAARVLFWMTWKYGVTGFEYYCYNIWQYNLSDKDGRRWPDKPFHPRGWGDTNGDGMLYYPGPDGPLSSVRFETIRDGIEDWESHQVLADALAALKAKAARDAATAANAAPLILRAEKILLVPQAVVGKDFTEWTWEPDVLLAARRDLGETLDALAALVTPEEIQAASDARRAAVIERQRAMLKARAEAARTAK